MTTSVGPLHRLFPLHRLLPGGVDTLVEANEAERAALAADLGLPAIQSLVGRFRVAGSRDRVVVTGVVEGALTQLCSVTLDEFPSAVREEVELVFASPVRASAREEATEVELSLEHDPPEELTGDTIDLGAVTAEHLALGLDPYPRKPGVAFDQPAPGASESPFAKLASLATRTGDREK
jgi:uncharacterized metal-binding protein YceD (DUF177 family)